MILEHTRKTNPETGMQVYVVKNDSRSLAATPFGAVLVDLDADQVVPFISFYPTEAQAVAKCEKILGI